MQRALSFAPFLLDVENSCLLREGVKVGLSPKDFALLHYLARHRGRVVSNAELLSAVWQGATVGPEVVKVRVQRVRRLLGDNVGSPRFIANVHGEGYRFVALSAAAGTAEEMPLVGRDAELARLEQLLAEASAGRLQIAFVLGEPGIGKTRLIDEVCERAGRAAAVCVARGQCIEHFGRDEPYRPVFDALGALARTEHRDAVRVALEEHAPSWLLELPSLSSPTVREALQGRLLPPATARMRRELASALESLTTSSGAPVLVLALEDLHWADPSTFGFLATLAGHERARILIVASYRPLELASPDHPLRHLLQDLGPRDAIVELELAPLSREEVGLYVDERFPAHQLPFELVDSLHRRTDGNPLFLTEVIRDLIARGVMTIRAERWILDGDATTIDTIIPSSIRRLASQLRDRLLAEEQRVLEAASLEGLEFSATSVAAALGADVAEIEEICLRLSERGLFIRFAGAEEWPDGAKSTRFAFSHGVHRELWQQRIAPHREQQWHRRIGERRQVAFGERADEIAGELALHFEKGGDEGRSIAYRERAARQATQRAAYAEASAHLLRALELLAKLRDPQERLRAELSLQVGLGTVAALAEGYGADLTARAYHRAREISGAIEASPDLYHPLFGLARYYWSKGELEPARDLGAQLLRVVEREPLSVRTAAAHAAVGSIAFGRGELRRARFHLQVGENLSAEHWHSSLLPVYGNDVEVVCIGSLATTLYLLGYADQAAQRFRRLREYDARGTHPFSRGAVAFGACFYLQLRGEALPLKTCVEDLRQLASRYELGQWAIFALMFGGWLAMVDGQFAAAVEQLEESVRLLGGVGFRLFETYGRGQLARAYAAAGQMAKARGEVAAALETCDRTEERWYQAALLCLDGELALRSAENSSSALEREAEECFLRAIEVARSQEAKTLELRAVLSLAALWRQRGEDRRAHRRVREVYEQFDEGFNSPDLLAARAFLDSTGIPSPSA